MSNKSKTDKTKSDTSSNVLSINNRIKARRLTAKRRLLLAPNNPHLMIIGDEFAMLNQDSFKGVYLIESDIDENDKRVIAEVIAPVVKNSAFTIRRVAIADDDKGTSYVFIDSINEKGELRPVVYTFRAFKDGSLRNQFTGHTVTTEVKKNLDRLPEFIEELIQATNPLRQIAKRTYGWHQNIKGEWFFLLENGCESKRGFLDDESAPFFLDQQARFGYEGAALTKPNDDVMRLLLTRLNPHPSFDAILFGLMGMMAHVSFIESTGKSPFVFELFALMRSGKSWLLDFFIHFFTAYSPVTGTGNDQIPPVFNPVGDTLRGRGLGRSAFRNCLHQYEDLKEIDEDADKKNDIRKETVLSYGDNRNQGIISSRDQSMIGRREATGAPLYTGESDWAVNSVKRHRGSDEFRAFSFLWPDDYECAHSDCGCAKDRGFLQSNEAVSRELAQRRAELYAWGADYRRWQLSLTESERKAIYADCTREAEEYVRESWPIKEDGGKHSGFIIYTITGVNLWFQYLKARHPKSFQIGWLNSHQDIFLENRFARTKWLVDQIKGNRVMTFGEFTIDAIRHLLLYGDYYIADNTGESLLRNSNSEWPVNKADLGYTSNGDSYRPNKKVLGYLSKSAVWINFHSDDFYRVLTARAREAGQNIPPKTTAWETLCSAEVAMRPLDGKGRPQGHCVRTRIGKKREWCIRIPVSKIWDIADGVEGEDE